MENFTVGFCISLFVWFFTWGLNRVYLVFKKFVS